MTRWQDISEASQLQNTTGFKSRWGNQRRYIGAFHNPITYMKRVCVYLYICSYLTYRLFPALTSERPSVQELKNIYTTLLRAVMLLSKWCTHFRQHFQWLSCSSDASWHFLAASLSTWDLCCFSWIKDSSIRTHWVTLVFFILQFQGFSVRQGQ